MLGRFIAACTLIAGTVAAPSIILKKRDVTTLSRDDLNGLAPYTQFARATYCPTSDLKNWSCGDACEALPGFQPTLVGGDGNAIQNFFVGYWPDQNTVVVAHEGTDPTQFLSILTDVNIVKDSLNTTLFPGVPSNVEVHDGFRNEHALTASQILEEVRKLMTVHTTQSVTCIGHSLGGALAELDAVFFALNLSTSTKIQAFTYGTPRVGNTAWAQLVDAKVPSFKRINNKKDIVPIVPGRVLGFSHPGGEIHITSSGNAVSCPGNDDATDDQCTIKTVPNILKGNILNHVSVCNPIFGRATLISNLASLVPTMASQSARSSAPEVLDFRSQMDKRA
ncbi:hypothetical protein Ac2012v2_005038 [Leucoagaricus gongylophorus]